jgi:hypothetical protein
MKELHMVDTVDMPEEDVLETLKNVRDAYQGVLNEKEAEHDRLHDDLDAKYAPIIAACLSEYYATVCRAHDAGFSTEDMNRKLTKYA